MENFPQALVLDGFRHKVFPPLFGVLWLLLLRAAACPRRPPLFAVASNAVVSNSETRQTRQENGVDVALFGISAASAKFCGSCNFATVY